jgi:hypothetical protein
MARRGLRRWWHSVRWLVLGGFWLLALALGYSGFEEYYASSGEARSPLSLLYLSLQLFPMQSGALVDPLVWQLELARWLAPGVATFTAVQAFALFFRERVESTRLRFFKGHVVICGLGRMGLHLTRDFRERGYRVVVVDRDPDNSMLEECREAGASIVVGDAADREVLRKAMVQRAKYLIAVCGDDGVNAEAAVHARYLALNQPGSQLTALVQIINPELCSLLRQSEIGRERNDSFQLEFFNVYDNAAEILLDACDAVGEEPWRACRPHLLVVGLGWLGQSLVVHAARRWMGKRSGPDDRLRITVIDLRAESKTESLCVQYPQLEKICDLITYSMDTRSAQFQRGAFLFDADRRCSITTAYICMDDDSRCLAAALALRQRLREHQIRIVVRMAVDAGLATLIDSLERDKGGPANLRAFGLLDMACTPESLLGSSHEILALSARDD